MVIFRAWQKQEPTRGLEGEMLGVVSVLVLVGLVGLVSVLVVARSVGFVVPSWLGWEAIS